MMDSLLSGTIFGIPEMMPDNCQATFLGSSGIIFGISRLFLGYKKKPKQGNKGCFRAFKRVFVLSYVNLCNTSQHIYHVNHPFEGCLDEGTPSVFSCWARLSSLQSPSCPVFTKDPDNRESSRANGPNICVLQLQLLHKKKSCILLCSPLLEEGVSHGHIAGLPDHIIYLFFDKAVVLSGH